MVSRLTSAPSRVCKKYRLSTHESSIFKRQEFKPELDLLALKQRKVTLTNHCRVNTTISVVGIRSFARI